MLGETFKPQAPVLYLTCAISAFPFSGKFCYLTGVSVTGGNEFPSQICQGPDPPVPQHVN